LSRRWSRGLTLVEASLGLAILGTLLAAVVVGGARLTGARLRLEACRLADEMLSAWWAKREEFPRTGEGPVPGHERWRWRTRLVEHPQAAALGAEVVALELFVSEGGDEAAGAAPPAARVELLLAGSKP